MGASRPHIESPRAWCGWERCHAAHAPAFHPACADQKTRSAEQTLPRISLGPGAQPNTHRDRRGPGQLGGETLRPSIRPDRRHDRREQTVPAGTVCGRYLYTLCINKRGYHHDLTLTLPVHAAPSKSVFRSVRILARRTSASTLQTSESLSRTVANTCMKQNLRWAQTCFLHSVHGSSRRGSNSERLPWRLPPR